MRASGLFFLLLLPLLFRLKSDDPLPSVAAKPVRSRHGLPGARPWPPHAQMQSMSSGGIFALCESLPCNLKKTIALSCDWPARTCHAQRQNPIAHAAVVALGSGGGALHHSLTRIKCTCLLKVLRGISRVDDLHIALKSSQQVATHLNTNVCFEPFPTIIDALLFPWVHKRQVERGRSDRPDNVVL